jgi:hypothetical protein
MPPLMIEAALYRDFYFPLNVFMHILSHEEGTARYLHYALFEREDEPILHAQERSTAMLLERVPPPPARILDVGVGLGTTVATLRRLGYDAEGITPDEEQIAAVEQRYGDQVVVACAAFEGFTGRAPYDAVLFQESSQYIDSDALFNAASAITRHVIVLDEFSVAPADSSGALHDFNGFLEAARRRGFTKTEEIDLSRMAAPTIDYFMTRIPRYRDSLVAELGLSPRQLDDLIESGHRYREFYANGTYVYRLLQFTR